MPVDQQATKLTMRYIQSAYGIASLNETLPPYMTRNYTLAPFEAPIDQESVPGEGTYTGPTIMYALDLACTESSNRTDSYDTSKSGCSAAAIDMNVTRDDSTNGFNNIMKIKKYVAMHIGYYGGGNADYYLEGATCPLTANVSFYAAFGRTKVNSDFFFRSNDPVI
jgi:hypothetical protein